MSRDHSAAKKFRDVVAAIARAEIEKRFPEDRYARVEEINDDTRRAVVQYNGEPEGNFVSLPYNSVKPSYVGQWVRVGGPPGDRHIVDTLGSAAAEARAEEVLSQATMPPKWMQPAIYAVESTPLIRDSNDSLQTLNVASKSVHGTVVRIPVDMSVVRVHFHVAAGRSGSGRIGLYLMDSAFNAELVATSGSISLSAVGERAVDLETAPSFTRGDEVLVGLYSGASETVTVVGSTFRQLRFLKAGDALTYQLSNQSGLPQHISNVQFNSRHADRALYFTLEGQPFDTSLS